jgi:Zn-dependent protease with chaperone function
MCTVKRKVSGKNFLTWLVLLTLLVPTVAWGVEQLRFRPGFNLFSPAQDVQVGKDAAKDADKQLPLLNDAQTLNYVNNLGRRLAAFAPNNNPDYVWQFKVVNSSDINAFALPGGYIYVNRGAIEAAQNEAEIAGVIAHEEGHVVMRHGTHMATQALLAQAPLAILGGLLGRSGSLTSQMLQLGISFGVNSLLLKNSRSAEAQADQVGTYILYHAGYDPYAMAQFFQIIEKKYPQRTIQFFSDHPNPENRVKAVDQEIPHLGPVRPWKTDSPEFESVKKHLSALPPPPKAKATPSASAPPPQPAGPPPAPSANLTKYDAGRFVIAYPDNWRVERSEDAVALLPPGGIVTNAEGDSNQAYGVAISMFQPRAASSTSWGLVEATNQLLDSLRQSNPNMRVTQQKGFRLRGRPALSTWIENDSPLEGQKEEDQLVTVREGGAMLSVIFIVPQSAAESYKPTFDRMLQSLELQ